MGSKTIVLICGTVLIVCLTLLVREVVAYQERKAKAKRQLKRKARSERPGELSVPVVISAEMAPDADLQDVTRVAVQPAKGRLPKLVSEEDPEEEDFEESKPLTLYEEDSAMGLDEPTGPHELILVSAAAQTDTGKKRKRNEDSFTVDNDLALFAVADGVGGHVGGDVASKLSVEAIVDTLKSEGLTGVEDPGRPRRGNELVWAVEAANSRVWAEAKENEQYEGMASTLLAARFSPRRQRVYIAHVGDSRLYRVRDGRLRQLTTDHTLAAKGIEGPFAGELRRAVGSKSNVKVDLIVDKPHPDDVYLLCSDGLSKMVDDETICAALSTTDDLGLAAEELVRLANEGGGRDNVTVVLVSVQDTTQLRSLNAKLN